MTHIKPLNKIALLIVIVVFFGCTIFFRSLSDGRDGLDKRILVPPPEQIERFQFGFKESVADSFWLRWVQDLDTCYVYDNKDNTPKIIPEDERLKIDSDTLVNVPRNKVCDNSWAFKMLDAVTKLDPRFDMPYLWGAPTLSVLVEDYEGASIIYDRGLELYPKNWELAYRAAYHFQFDKHDLKRAADLLVMAGQNGAPFWVQSLAARLYSRTGQIELGLSTLLAYRKGLTEEKQIAPVDKRIAALKAELEKELQKRPGK